jgi:hypothetical protein
MPVAAPNQTSTKILSSILQLKQFTVAELCLHAGLERTQVYRELADLQEREVLRSNPIRNEGATAPRHRPTKLYELTSDQGLLDELEKQLASFFPESDPNSNRHLKRAKSELESIGNLALETAIALLDGNGLERWQEDLENRFSEVKRRLELASWESEVDFSEGDHSEHPIVLALRSFEALHSKFLEQIREAKEEQSRRKRAIIRSSWTDVVSSFLPSLSPIATVVAARASRAMIDDVVRRSGISTFFAEELKRLAETNPHVVPGIMIDDLEPYINSLQLDFREVHSRAEFLAALSKNWISYGNKVEPAWLCTQALAASSKDYRLIFNEANLAQLAQESAKAYASWARFLAIRKPKTNTSEQTLIAQVQGKDWSLNAYEEAVRIITKECEASVSAFSETPFEREEEFAIEPKLYNPLYNETERESPLIPIAEPLAPDTRLHVLTAEATKPLIVGLPVVARAGILRCRMSQREAWRLAKEAPNDQRIVKVDFFRGAAPEIRLRAENILRTNLDAHVCG